MTKLYSIEEVRLLRERIAELKEADYSVMSERDAFARRVELSCNEARLDAFNIILNVDKLYQ